MGLQHLFKDGGIDLIEDLLEPLLHPGLLLFDRFDELPSVITQT